MRVILSGNLTTSRVISQVSQIFSEIEKANLLTLDQIAQIFIGKGLTTYFFHDKRIIHVSLGENQQLLTRVSSETVLMKVLPLPLSEMTQAMIEEFISR
jgi:hypothetical protein